MKGHFGLLHSFVLNLKQILSADSGALLAAIGASVLSVGMASHSSLFFLTEELKLSLWYDVKSVCGMASYQKESFNSTVKKTKEEWDAIPTDKIEAPMAASIAPLSAYRICFKF